MYMNEESAKLYKWHIFVIFSYLTLMLAFIGLMFKSSSLKHIARQMDQKLASTFPARLLCI